MYWDIYELTSSSSRLTGVMLRGRIRKFCLKQKRNVLVENASNKENCVRFAVCEGEEVKSIISYLQHIILDLTVTLVKVSVPNPILSNIKVNLSERYSV